MVKNYQFRCFCFLLLQAANVHAGINGIRIAIMILEDCGRGVGMHYFGTKRPGEKFLGIPKRSRLPPKSQTD